MGFIDIHSHILHGIDDGSKSLEMSLELLEMMKAEGITDVIATPHFDARYENFEEHNEKVDRAYNELLNSTSGKELPNILLGSEVYYFEGMGKSYGIKNFTLSDSEYILVELSARPIDDTVIEDICNIYENLGLRPILAHIERYAGFRGFKKLLRLVEDGIVLTQVNAESVFNKPFKNVVKKLIKRGYVTFIATDTHSVDTRPPMLKRALDEIEKQFGKDIKETFKENSKMFLDTIKNTKREKDII